jgi:hypothetical protein
MHVEERKLDRKLDPEVRGYLMRRFQAAQDVIDTVPVFSKRYHTAVDELEEVADLLGIDPL